MYDNIKTLEELQKAVEDMGINPGAYYILPKKMVMEHTYSYIQEVEGGWEVGVCERADVSARFYSTFAEAVERFMLQMKYS